jgi:starch-binding outer membrane protein, SusD/RagB family
MIKYLSKSNFKTSYLFLYVILISFSSCKKFIEVDPPVDQVISATVFSNDQTATAAVTGVYNQIMNSRLFFLDGSMTVFCGLSSDEFFPSQSNPNILPFYTNSIPATNSIVRNNLWNQAYKLIYQINSCLEGLSNSSQVNNSVKQELIGEMEFARALSYFYLVNIFGDVPLVLTTDSKINTAMGRISISQIYAQVVKDLNDAQMLLGDISDKFKATRPNKWSATALLARVYLYQNDWANAEAMSTSVINSGKYTIYSDLSQVFMANSTESIFSLVPVNPDDNTAEGATFIPNPYSPGIKPIYQITSYLLNSFQINDLRFTNWIGKDTSGGIVYYYPLKYKVWTDINVTEYNIVLRYAEQYLIRAEARAQRGIDLNGSAADLNVIRNRAGLTNSTSVTQTSLLTDIAHERQVELFAEWGHRWFDLKRTGQADIVLGSEKPGWKPTAALYPIPITQIKLNHSLTQNDGY